MFLKIKSQCSFTKLIALCTILSVVHCDSVCVGNSSEIQRSNTLIDFLNVADCALNSAKQYVKSSSHMSLNPMDCAEIVEKNASSRSGIYNIWPRSRITQGPVTVYCDMEDDGGGWTIIQRRGDFDSFKDYFYREWAFYKKGFGDPLKDFWLGNDNIFALTNQRACAIKFTLSDWEGNSTYATYDEFWIDGEEHKYMSHVTGYRGTAGDSFTFTNGYAFTTKDVDNDKNAANCAVKYKGAWWYTSCHSSNLNGLYLKGHSESFGDGVNWLTFRGHHYSLKDTVMKIRPRDFRATVTTDMTPM